MAAECLRLMLAHDVFPMIGHTTLHDGGGRQISNGISHQLLSNEQQHIPAQAELIGHQNQMNAMQVYHWHKVCISWSLQLDYSRYFDGCDGRVVVVEDR